MLFDDSEDRFDQRLSPFVRISSFVGRHPDTMTAQRSVVRPYRHTTAELFGLRTDSEIAYFPEGMSDESRAALEKVGVGPEDDLFVRHTYLGAVIGMVVQASFGIDIRRLAATDPADLLQGRELYRATGLQGVLESDFFTWPN